LFPGGALGGMKVVLDCANGAMSHAAPAAVAALGADVTVIHGTPNGTNINDRCGATNPASLTRAVVDLGADVGLAFDGDGDRVICRDLATTGDGLLAGLRLLYHVRSASLSLSRLAADVMVTYPQVLVNVKVRERHPRIADELAPEVSAAEAQIGENGRVLLRA